MTPTQLWQNMLDGKETWTIDWHEGTNCFGGKSFNNRFLLMAAMREIQDERNKNPIGYIKTGISLSIAGKVIWQDRIDIDGYDITYPWDVWAFHCKRYKSERGEYYARLYGVDRDERVKMYELLLAGDYDSIVAANGSQQPQE